MPSPMLGKVFLSVKWISTPPMTVMDTVTDAMIRAARGAVSGLRFRSINARGCNGGGANWFPLGVANSGTSFRLAYKGRLEQEQNKTRLTKHLGCVRGR